MNPAGMLHWMVEAFRIWPARRDIVPTKPEFMDRLLHDHTIIGLIVLTAIAGVVLLAAATIIWIIYAACGTTTR